MSPYLGLLILDFFPARLATLPYGLDSNITQLPANLLTKLSVFYYLQIVSCNPVSIKLLLLLLLLLYNSLSSSCPRDHRLHTYNRDSFTDHTSFLCCNEERGVK